MSLANSNISMSQSLASRRVGLAPTLSRPLIQQEVRACLPNEQRRLADAFENQAFFDYDATRYLPKRDAEGEFDFQGRPHRTSGLLREVVEILCDHLYSPGPNRSLEGSEAAGQYLNDLYEREHIDAIMHEADVLSTLNDVAAIQVEATEDAENPLKLRIWGAEEFHVFIDPNDPSLPYSVVTIDRYDGQTRYRLWFDDVVETYITRRFSTEMTNGGRSSTLVSSEPNTYGCLPFTFIHYRLPVRDFWTSGVGKFVRMAETRLDARLSDIDEAVQKFLFPVGLASGVDPHFNPVIEPGRFIRIPQAGINVVGGEFGPTIPATLSYLQAQIDVIGAWEDLTKYVNQVLEACRVPASAARMDDVAVGSGIQLIVEQAPLLTRARNRRSLFQRYETRLARTILTCAGNHFGRPELTEAAKSGRLTFAWPEVSIPIPGPDRDNNDLFEINTGLASRIEVLMRRRGISRDQAIAALKRIAEDEAEANAILPIVEPTSPELSPATGT